MDVMDRVIWSKRAHELKELRDVHNLGRHKSGNAC